MRSFVRIFELCFILAALAASVAPCGASVVLDAPGHVAVEGAPVTARGGEPGAAWRLVDWRGREVEGISGMFNEDGTTTLPPLPAGYYRLVEESQIPNPQSPISPSLATLAVVSEGARTPGARTPPQRGAEGGAASFFAADSAASYIARGAFDCPWNGGDTIRTIADLAQLAGIRHLRERMRWNEVQPSPDQPPDFSRLLASADLFHERGISLSGCFHDCPGWAGRLIKIPGDLNALYDFCQETATAFSDRMEDWEFWNEPDIQFAPEPVWDYAAALKAAYLGFKAARPDMPVLNGALCQLPATPYETALLANDAAHYLDIFNYHTYSPPARLHDIITKLRKSLRNGGAGDRSIWITECGTNNEGPGAAEGARPGLKAHSPGQELVVAEHCAKANIALQMEGVERNYIFILGAYSERGGAKDWGMLRRDGTAKPVYATQATMIRELGDATLLGALDAPTGIHAYLYEQPDGTQTVAFWSESPLDTVTTLSTVVEAEPEGAQEWVLLPSAPEGEVLFRLSDMCGSVSSIAPDTTGAITLSATRYPSYLSGLRGLKAAVPAKAATPATQPAACLAGHESSANESIDPTIILRLDLAPGDFEISGRKTLAVTKTEAPRLRVQVWNFGDTAKTGTVEAAGAILEGLPTEPFVLPPRSSPPVEFDCTLRAQDSSSSATLVLTGLFNGRRSTRLSMPILFEPLLLAACETTPINWSDPALWQRNDSAATYSATWDEAEQAMRFDVTWEDPKIDRWFYPVLPLVLPGEGGGEDFPRPSPLQGAVRAVFEVKTVQDKVENDFKPGGGCFFMLLRKDGDGHPQDYIPYAPPTSSWERRYVELSTAASGLGDVEAIRVGANPMGMRLTYWIRNLAILKQP